MKKGMILLAKAEVMTGYRGDFSLLPWECIHNPSPLSKDSQNLRCLFRRENDVPISVILLGKTTLQTGKRWGYDPPTFRADKHHKVWAVCSYSPTDNRYTTPFYVLEDDLIRGRIIYIDQSPEESKDEKESDSLHS